MTFDDLAQRWPWEPIPGCPGRHRLARAAPKLGLPELVGASVVPRAFRVPAARDEVLVVRFEDGAGLISYRHADGSLTHTLNTPQGLERKLCQLGISWQNSE